MQQSRRIRNKIITNGWLDMITINLIGNLLSKKLKIRDRDKNAHRSKFSQKLSSDRETQAC
jgi:hypothetical protein